jgi:hypothetical protein
MGLMKFTDPQHPTWCDTSYCSAERPDGMHQSAMAELSKDLDAHLELASGSAAALLVFTHDGTRFASAPVSAAEELAELIYSGRPEPGHPL